MKKNFFILSLLVMCGVSVASSQRVSNGYGQALTVTINNETKEISKNGVQVFSANTNNVKLECKTADGMFFVVSKNVYNNAVIILPEDGKGAVAGPSENNSTPIVKSVKQSSIPVKVKTPVNETVYAPQVQQQVGEKVALIFTGKKPFTIVTTIGRGLQFRGADTANDSRKNRYVINTIKGRNLEMGAAVNQKDIKGVYFFAQIRKMLMLADTAFIFDDNDLKIESEKLQDVSIQLLAQGYKIVLDIDGKGKISMGNKDVSRKVKLPVGQCLIEVSFTDPDGQPHRLSIIFMHVTENDKRVVITEKMLKNSLEITTY